MFNSLHILGFRAFEDLQITGLGRVNLLVGENNIGKTTVLEAIKLRCEGEKASDEVVRLLKGRQELLRDRSMKGDPPQDWDIRRLFHSGSSGTTGRPQYKLSIGPIDDPEMTLTLALGWARVIRNARGVSMTLLDASLDGGDEAERVEVIILSFGPQFRRVYDLETFPHYGRSLPVMPNQDSGTVNCHYLPAGGLNVNDTGVLWARIALTDLEQDVLASLKIIAPDVERISWLEIFNAISGREGMALVRRAGRQTPEPLKGLGEGMAHIFNIALGLANAKGGVFLVDEIENGIHYSVQQELWSFIFEMSSRLDCQVFATTHSWDCIEAFQQAASARSAEAALVRLSRQENMITAYTFDQRQLEILTKQSIEVR